MNTISNFHSSLYILHRCHENIETVFFEFANYQAADSKRHFHSSPLLRNYLILEAASFLDEYEYNFLETPNRQGKVYRQRRMPTHSIEPEFCDRIEKLHTVIVPVLRTIGRWRGIRQYRNNYVAHSSRADWNADNKLRISGQECYDAPRTVSEFQVMRDLIHLVFGLIAQEFKMELIDAEHLANIRKPVVNPLKDNTTINTELADMIVAAKEASESSGKEYSFNIERFSYDPLQLLVSGTPTFIHPLSFEKSFLRMNYAEIRARVDGSIEAAMQISENKNTPN